MLLKFLPEKTRCRQPPLAPALNAECCLLKESLRFVCTIWKHFYPVPFPWQNQAGTLLRLWLQGTNPVLVMGILTCYPHMEHLTCSYYYCRCVVTHGSECHLTFTLDILVGKLQGFNYDSEDNPRDPSPPTELLQTNGLIFRARAWLPRWTASCSKSWVPRASFRFILSSLQIESEGWNLWGRKKYIYEYISLSFRDYQQLKNTNPDRPTATSCQWLQIIKPRFILWLYHIRYQKTARLSSHDMSHVL